MKRFHVHVRVADLPRNIAFYSAMFNQPPARTEADYAKWMLADPPVNFAISTRGGTPGVDHLGIQVESDEELKEMRGQAVQTDMALLDEGETTCCYAKSDSYWVTDPQGVAWEQFRTLGSVPLYGSSGARASEGKACCATPAAAPAGAAKSACC